MFRSHLLSLTLFAAIVSFLLALIKYNDRADILRYAGKLFFYMLGGVILFSWLMRFI